MKHNLLAMACAILITIVGFRTAEAVPILSPVTGNYYELVPTVSVWQGANSTANAPVTTFMGIQGHLVSINSGAENQWLLDNILVAGNYWIGGLQDPGAATPSDGWSWVDASPYVYENWAPGEPNLTPNPNQNAMGIDGTTGLWADYSSIGAGGAFAQGYIVEYTAVIPEPTSVALLLSGLVTVVVYRRKKSRA